MEHSKTKQPSFSFLQGGGEMGKLIRSKDWSETPIGIPDKWPQSLRTTLSIILNSKFPMFLFWGTELICFYNDAYRPSLGNDGKHPNILGSRGEDYWQEIWPVIKPLIDQVLAGGEATWSEDQLIPIYRNGKIEDVYWTFSYSPVNDESGKPAGVFVTCNETTGKVITLKKIEESNRRYFNNIMQAPVAMCILIGQDFVVDIANEHILEIWGKKAEEVMNKPIFEGLPEAKGQGLEALLENVYNTGERFVANERPVDLPRNGKIETTYLNFVYEALKEPDGTVSGIVAIATDVSLQVLARTKIEESDQRLRSLVKNAPFPIGLYVGKEMRIELANEAIIKAWGKGNDVTGKLFKDVLPELGDQEIFEQLDNVFTTGIPFHAINRYVNLVVDGKDIPHYYNYSFTPLFDSTGKVYGVMNTASDVTDLSVAKKKIEESEEDLRSMALQAPIGICVMDAATLISEIVNDSFIEVAGKTYEEIAGKYYWDTFAEAKPYYEAALNKVVEEGVPFYANEVELMLIRHGKEEIIYVTFVYSPLKNIEGKVKKVAVWVLENTLQVKARQKIEEADKRFRNTVRQAPIGITILRGPQFIVEMANDAYLELVDRKETEFVGRPLFDSLPEVQETVHPLLDNVLNTGIPFHGIEYPIPVNRYGKQELSYFDFLYHPLKEDNGKISGIIVTVTDVSASVKAKHSIAESEKQFRNMVIQSPVPMTIFRGHDYVIELANTEMFKNIWRKEEKDVIGKKLLDVFPELKEQKYPGLLNKVYTSGIAHREKESIAYVQGDDGMRKFYFDYEYKPLFETDGSVSGIMITLTDVTEKVEARQKVEENEERLNIVIDATELGTWELNLTTREVNYSDRYLEILGHKEKVVLTHEEIIRHLHPEDLPTREKAFAEAFITGSLHYESRLLWPDKSIHWIEGKGKVFYDEQNKPAKMVGTVRDITNEKNYQQELQQREQKFRLLADSMPQHVWTSDTEGNLNYFNKSVFDYSGLTHELIHKDGWIQIVHPDDREENIRTWMNSVITGKDFLLEHRFRRHDGEHRWQLSRALPVRDSDGKIQMWVGTSTDIDEIKKHEQEKDDFIKIASHELKTPITSIKGYVQLLLAQDTSQYNPLVTKSLLTIDKQVAKLTKLITDLLDVTKIEMGKFQLSKTTFSVNELVKDIVENIQTTAASHKIIFNLQPDISVHADKDRISQVLTNLLTNAIKYSPAADKVIIETFTQENELVISIQDFGIGIVNKDHGRIFERFYRVEGDYEKTFPGFGIGLFIVKEIISNHDGKVWLKSSKGNGSTFYFSLPL